MRTHEFAPHALAVESNIPPMAAMSSPIADRSPVNAMYVYLRTQAMTQVYPMANARDPTTGIMPMRSPSLRLPRPTWVHLPKAPMGPEPAERPSANSDMTPVLAMRTTKMKYGMRKVSPPQMQTIMGKRHMFPMPTADPMHERMNPRLDVKPSRDASSILSITVLIWTMDCGINGLQTPIGVDPRSLGGDLSDLPRW